MVPAPRVCPEVHRLESRAEARDWHAVHPVKRRSMHYQIEHGKSQKVWAFLGPLLSLSGFSTVAAGGKKGAIKTGE